MAQHHPSPPMQMQMHYGAPLGAAPPAAPPPPSHAPSRQISAINESVWMQIGSFAEVLGNVEEAIYAYEHALHANSQSIPAMNAISLILRSRDDFPKAIEYLQAILKLDQNNGEVWGSLGHCYLMMDDLQQAYAAYQSALVNLRNPKEPKLWYGIGILYDRYGSLDHAEEAFSQVMSMQPDFDKANEIYFRLGIIYKQQQKYNQSLDCFKYIVNSPPPPLTEEDIWFQVGHVYEQQKDFDNAKGAYLRVLERDPNHAKVLQQLGWLYHNQSSSFASQDRAIEYLEKSVAADNNDAQSWYLLGRCYMSQQKYPKAYEAYQQAVYREGRNPTFWCSIGVLYYQINQYRDALDAYSRAIKLNPFISEVWYDLGTLYESCNNQISDALDAYQRAAELDPTNPHIKARLQLLRSGSTNGVGSAPMPTDVHPHAYQNTPVGPPAPQWTGASSQQSAPMSNGPPPPPGPGSANWGRLTEMKHPSQSSIPFDQREAYRGPPPPPSSVRPASPRQEQALRPYPEPGRPGPGGLSVPSPISGPNPLTPGGPLRRSPPPPPPPSHYGPPPQQQPPPPPLSSSQQPQPRVQNPNYVGPAPMSSSNGMNGPPPHATSGSNPSMYRASSPPRNEPRSLHDNRMPSPKSAYPQHQSPYPQHPDASHNGPIESGPPPPPPPPPQSSNLHDDRPPSVGPKRMREWEEADSSVKKPASEEARARLDDIRHRRPSTPPHETFRRNSSEARRAEDQRRMEDIRRPEEHQLRHSNGNDSYHPSDAAHHPPAHTMSSHLPPMQAGGPVGHMPHDGPLSGPDPKDYPQDDRKRLEHPPPPPSGPASASEPERATRKVEVDEDYDDSGEDDKKSGPVLGGASNVLTGSGSGPGDLKMSTPSSASINGIITKSES
ncbi:glucose repression mediator protein [Sporothrix epigloea]|uniref:Glucose repression mediator protein n=1 Tax=Sporothrix epigloea TaxID=1892477 RepID=A0ABP0DUQ1_9PEZI